MATLPKYQYSMLSETNSYRLFRLHLNEDCEPLEGELLHYKIDQSPPHVCVSYTWDTAHAKQPVEMQGQILPIMDTVYSMLQWIRNYQRKTTSELLWIDSICINQDDMKERSEQVWHMKKIYSEAQLVLVYLGEEADGSWQIPQLYRKIPIVISNWLENGVDRPKGSDFIANFLPWRIYESIGLPKIDDPVWEAYRAFLRRPWFLRTWILQEAILASKLFFVCGRWGCSSDLLILGWIWSLAAGLPYITTDASVTTNYNIPEARTINQIQLMLGLGLGTDKKKSPSLIDLLQSSRQALASNPRDYVYGLLGLTSDEYQAKIIVDYEEPIAETYRKVAKTIVHQGDGIKLLYNIYGLISDLALPSWIPDWSIQGVPNLSLAPVPINTADASDNPYVCAGGNLSDLHMEQEDNTLVCKGYIIDVIKAITEPIGNTTEEELHDENRVPQDEDSFELEPNRDPILSRFLSEMRTLLNTNSAYLPQKHDEIIWRTSIWNRSISHQAKAPDSYAKLYEDYFKPSDAPRRLAEEQDNRRILGWATSICMQMRRCSTRKGYLGHVPKSAMVEDVICVIAGAAIPFTIRPNEKGYSLIGQCYLHGYMEGEALNNSDMVKQDIVLV